MDFLNYLWFIDLQNVIESMFYVNFIKREPSWPFSAQTFPPN